MESYLRGRGQYSNQRLQNVVNLFQDDIVGYITRGRGVSVHRKDCSNISNIDPNRLIDVYWDADDESTYNVEIQIIAFE